jgi:hypothetical protein
VLFADDKATLRKALDAVEAFLAEPLGHALKPTVTRLAPAHTGLPFLGWQIFRGTTRLRPANRRRIRQRVRHRLVQHHHGLLDTDSLAACLRSVAEHLAHGDTLRWRREQLTPITPVLEPVDGEAHA